MSITPGKAIRLRESHTRWTNPSFEINAGYVDGSNLLEVLGFALKIPVPSVGILLRRLSTLSGPAFLSIRLRSKSPVPVMRSSLSSFRDVKFAH